MSFSTASLEWSQIPLKKKTQKKQAREPLGLAVQRRNGGALEEVRQKWGAVGLKYRKFLGILLWLGHMSPQRNPGTENFAEVWVPGGTKERMSVSGQVRSCVMMGCL